MLSRNFRLQKVGNISWLMKNYNFSQIAFSIDELIILDVTREKKDQDKFCEHVRILTQECFIPVAAGGGIRDVNYAGKLIHSGADKIVINSAATFNPQLIYEISSKFGQQSVVLSIDTKQSMNEYVVYTDNGFKLYKRSLNEYLRSLTKYPIGELFLNSIDKDGTGQGYDPELLKYITSELSMPVILVGGAGNYEHLAQGLTNQKVDAVATAHLFNFVGDGLEKARKKLLKNGFQLTEWDSSKATNLHNIFKK